MDPEKRKVYEESLRSFDLRHLARAGKDARARLEKAMNTHSDLSKERVGECPRLLPQESRR